ncbi:TPA: LAGLIDADG family homing endonuclease [Bacillus cereus]|nr:LAGLIDADG family homing endonuclease [Bacillus cereus]HDR4742335.1 LAGLIDADG family homing endonuclease [Bacillus cereus]HDR4747921.1 LAGLIDADG family homing endonuclease [Bacillus cereus]HDR4753396.1 LAGLIDADG family homing endonuclease [Bacillus cereus]HDR4770605.1 LAGLIDADG family homing endonuclease [Bacillus cereus]
MANQYTAGNAAPKLDYMKDELIRMYQSGMSLYAISKATGEYVQAIATTLDRYIERIPKKVIKINPDYFESIDCEEKAYFLGFIAADGALVDNGQGVMVLTISIKEDDRIILEKLKECLGSEHNIQILSRGQVRLSLANKKLTSDLMKHGIEQRKSLTMGKMLHHIPEEHRRHFIRGYFDGDGSVFTCTTGRPGSPRTTRYIGIRGTKEFLEEIQEYCGIKGTIQFNTGTHQLRCGAEADVTRFRELIYNDSTFCLERKREKFY